MKDNTSDKSIYKRSENKKLSSQLDNNDGKLKSSHSRNTKNSMNLNSENSNNSAKEMIEKANDITSKKDKNKKDVKKRKKRKFLGDISKDKFSNNSEALLKIDFNFLHLIDLNDDDIDRKELNVLPYLKALKNDKRNRFEIFLSIFANEIGFLRLFYYKNIYSHFSLTISVYIFELLFDLAVNCFLYTDDAVSEKYHNDGNLSMLTSLSLSFISNIISSIVVYIIAKLTNYTDFLELIISNVKNETKYYDYIIRFMKYIKIRLSIFYILQLSLILVMIYYLFVFCTVYIKSQISITINYIVGTLTSLVISTILTIIIYILRSISLNYHLKQLYNISRYIYDRF